VEESKRGLLLMLLAGVASSGAVAQSTSTAAAHLAPDPSREMTVTAIPSPLERRLCSYVGFEETEGVIAMPDGSDLAQS